MSAQDNSNDNAKRKALYIRRAKILRAALTDPKLNGTDYRILCILADMANSLTGECFPSHGKIGEKCSMSDEGVRRAVQRLRAKGYLQWDKDNRRDKGRGTIKYYSFHLPDCDTPDSPEPPENDNDHRDRNPGSPDDRRDKNTAGQADHRYKNPTTTGTEIPANLIEKNLTTTTTRSSSAARFEDMTGLSYPKEEILDQLISDGADIEKDVVPTVLSIVDEMQKGGKTPPRSWALFNKHIRNARTLRLNGGRQPPGSANKEEDWEGRLRHGRKHQQWHISDWGPMPHDEGCRVPAELLKPDDGKDWEDWYYDDIRDRWETRPKPANTARRWGDRI
jgi:hypothetical protein